MVVTNGAAESPNIELRRGGGSREAGADQAPEPRSAPDAPRPADALRAVSALLTGVTGSDLGLAPEQQRQLCIDVDMVALAARGHDGVGLGEELDELRQGRLEQGASRRARQRDAHDRLSARM